MGNSNTTLQNIVDSVSTIGDLTPVLLNTGGFANEPAITIANDVMMELLSERFPWKWNRIKLPPFALNNRQQDYAYLNVFNIGWLENGFRVDMNSTQVPPPVTPIRVVRDLPVSRSGAGWPSQACWFPNDQLEWSNWPGPGKVYVNPLGQPANPDNPPTNIMLADYTLLVLTTYGVTGLTPPVLPPAPTPKPDNWPVGVVIDDGTCKWTVADPSAQGIRMDTMPSGSSGGNVWLIRLFAQKKAPVITDINAPLNPIPDDQIKWFRDGFIAYAHRHSTVPAVKARFPMMKSEWLASMSNATKQADREDEAKGFYPAQSLLSPEYAADPGPGNPYWRGAN